MVEVLYFADFKSITNKEKEHFNLHNKKSLMDLIRQLTAKYPKLGQVLLEPNHQEIKKSISIAINHSIIDRHEMDTYKLENEDKVSFLLPVSGG
ncbi:MAG: MoaD family protein [Candidatus Lokiarchaeota archaeon]|nr:MoaD family protein [Candidatus Lokiarchaeota archaeon]